MNTFSTLATGLTSLLMIAQQSASLRPDAPIACTDCAEWNAPRKPDRVFGNTYYVGMAGLSAVLIASDRGPIPPAGALPQSAPSIEGHVRQLGFRTEDMRLMLTSRSHCARAGGIAALQRASGAQVSASAAGALAI